VSGRDAASTRERLGIEGGEPGVSLVGGFRTARATAKWLNRRLSPGPQFWGGADTRRCCHRDCLSTAATARNWPLLVAPGAEARRGSNYRNTQVPRTIHRENCQSSGRGVQVPSSPPSTTTSVTVISTVTKSSQKTEHQRRKRLRDRARSALVRVCLPAHLDGYLCGGFRHPGEMPPGGACLDSAARSVSGQSLVLCHSPSARGCWRPSEVVKSNKTVGIGNL
jgi:hypothetical protein